MATKSELLQRCKEHYAYIDSLLDDAARYTDEQLNRPEADGGWSAIQTIHHLILAEQMSLRYVQKKLSDPQVALESAGLKSSMRDLLLKLYLKYGGKRKAPAVVADNNLPDYANLADTRAKWQKVQSEWETFFNQMPEGHVNKAVYKHPGIGRLSWSGMLSFFREHAARHSAQIRRALTVGVFVLISVMGWSQQEAPLGCGTVGGWSGWLEQYLDHPSAYRTAADTTLYTRLQVHLVAKNDGTGRFRAGQLLDALCRLNLDFAASKIQFFYDKPWNNLNRTEWWDHNLLTTGIQMMLQNKVDSSINAYFVADPAGNCGYNLPYGGVAMKHSCSGPNDHTFAHEVGHNLRLPHPFIGWEGKTYNYDTPTPTVLTYDYTHFHDTLDTGPTIDTALVEYVDRTKNCNIAADRLCLTQPDYIAQRWPCNSSNMSNIKQKDPDGVDFYSDGTLFMSYSFDNCQNRFSDDEIQVMRANLLSEKISYVRQDYQHTEVAGTATPVAPVGGEQVSADAVTMHWSRVPGATHYVVQGNRLTATFPIIDFELVVTDTFATAFNLLANRTWYYRVRPFNASSFCAPFSANGVFFTLPPMAVQEPDKERVKLYPTVLQEGMAPRIVLPEGRSFSGLCTVTDAHGRLLFRNNVQNLSTHQELPGQWTGMAGGHYFVHLLNSTEHVTLRVVVE